MRTPLCMEHCPAVQHPLCFVWGCSLCLWVLYFHSKLHLSRVSLSLVLGGSLQEPVLEHTYQHRCETAGLETIKHLFVYAKKLLPACGVVVDSRSRDNRPGEARKSRGLCVSPLCFPGCPLVLWPFKPARVWLISLTDVPGSSCEHGWPQTNPQSFPFSLWGKTWKDPDSLALNPLPRIIICLLIAL